MVFVVFEQFHLNPNLMEAQFNIALKKIVNVSLAAYSSERFVKATANSSTADIKHALF